MCVIGTGAVSQGGSGREEIQRCSGNGGWKAWDAQVRHWGLQLLSKGATEDFTEGLSCTDLHERFKTGNMLM